MPGDDNLKTLYSERRRLRAELEKVQACITAEEITTAKSEGRIVGSIEELHCEEHPDSPFIDLGSIKKSGIPVVEPDVGGRALKLYRCGGCQPVLPGLFKGRESEPEEGSYAHDCFVCDGIVIGHYGIKDVGPERQVYFCKVCGTKLGENDWAAIID